MRIMPLDRNGISYIQDLLQEYGDPEIEIYSMCGTIFHTANTFPNYTIDYKASIYYVTYDFQNTIKFNTTNGVLTFNMSDHNNNAYWGFDKAILII